eukprot:363881-Chlamydomonas_euryale.AAC.1
MRARCLPPSSRQLPCRWRAGPENSHRGRSDASPRVAAWQEQGTAWGVRGPSGNEVPQCGGCNGARGAT